MAGGRWENSQYKEDSSNISPFLTAGDATLQNLTPKVLLGARLRISSIQEEFIFQIVYNFFDYLILRNFESLASFEQITKPVIEVAPGPLTPLITKHLYIKLVIPVNNEISLLLLLSFRIRYSSQSAEFLTRLMQNISFCAN